MLKMFRKLSLENIILGQLKKGPHRPKEIVNELNKRKILKAAGMYNSSISSSISGLKKKGLIRTSNTISVGKANYNIYKITKKGKEQYDKCMDDLTKTPIEISVNWNPVLMNIEYATKQEKLKYLDNIKKEIMKTKEEVYVGKKFNTYSDKLIFNQQEKIILALEEWINEAIEEILLLEK